LVELGDDVEIFLKKQWSGTVKAGSGGFKKAVEAYLATR
jgi:hypothetical protein